jgi:TPR repeat protein
MKMTTKRKKMKMKNTTKRKFRRSEAAAGPLGIRLFIVAGMLALSPGTARAGDPPPDGESAAARYERAVRMWKKDPEKHAARAAALLRSAAAEGDLKSRELLAHFLAEGLGVDKDEAAALECLREVAEAGVTRAQHNYAVMLETGRGTPAAPDRAIGWFEKAAASGFLPSRLRLAQLHYFGATGVPRDHAKALPHVRAAAEAGDAWGQNILGTMHEFGQAVVADRLAARRWYELAARQDNVKAQGNLGRMLRSGKPEERNVVEALKWLILAAKGGDTASILTLEDLSHAFDPSQMREAELRAAQHRDERRGATSPAR